MALHKGGNCISRRERWCPDRLPILLILALVLLLAGCGQATVSSQVAVNTSTAPASTATPAKVNGATANGCPASQAPPDAASFKPDVIVSQNPQAAGAAQPITLTQGQRLEIRLQPGYSWELTIADQNHILVSTSPGGWYNASVNSCIWHFTAGGSGDAQLSYRGALICPPLKACPSVEQSATYHVTIR